MSDLLRNMFHKKKAVAYSLEPLSEDPSQEPELDTTEAPPSAQDEELEKSYTESKHSVFPIEEAYTDPDTALTFSTYYSPPGSSRSPIFFAHHGAGSSAMTFWALAKYLENNWAGDEKPGVFAFDARGHGNSSDSDPLDYSLTAFTADTAYVLKEFHTRHPYSNPLCLVGHSLGGAVLTSFLSSYPYEQYNVRGLIVIDIVEETAVRALLSIALFLSRRPNAFASYSEAIKWHLLSRLLRNEDSANVSVPNLVCKDVSGRLVWKSNLAKMSKFWDSWFSGMSARFIECGSNRDHKVAKLLLLSSNETLDKQLMIGQMQGKYQLVVFNNSLNAGHFLHEDIPKQLAMSIMGFMRRNDINNIERREAQLETLWGGSVKS